MAELFIEILSADIPARMQKKAAEDFVSNLLSQLEKADIPFDEGRFQSTPRRLIFTVTGLPEEIADQVEERRGPKVGAPDKAVEGFLRGAGLKSIDDCVVKETPKGSFYFAEIVKKGGATIDALKDMIPEAIAAMSWPKSMRWGTTRFRWARPLKNIVALFEGRVIPFSLDLGNDNKIVANNKTVGHRFLSPDSLTIDSYADYQKKMHQAYVMIAREERKKIILDEARLIAKSKGLVLHEDPALIEEIVGLIEWPVVLQGAFDKDFLKVPQECLITTMKKDQKYIPLMTKEGELSNLFIIVSNMITKDQGKAIIAGNEKVLRARLSDAKFFYEQDLKETLEARLPRLKEIKFHDRLGNLYERTGRLEKLAVALADAMDYKADEVAEAAKLCKCDLLTGMVGEFPELQGIMGRYYALAEKHSQKTAYAIEDHYKPAGPDDTCPQDPVSVQLALAEKIDILSGFFAINEKPTGSKDPFALRRAGLGIIRLCLENDLNIDIAPLFDKAVSLYGELVDAKAQAVRDELLTFLGERMKVALKDQGVRHDLIDSVFSLGLDGNLVRVVSRVQALQNFLQTEDGANLLAGYKRASNIVAIETEKDKQDFDGRIDESLFSQAEEKQLFESLSQSEKRIEPALKEERFEIVMEEMAKLRAPIDAFFDRVTVNDNDPNLRQNRLNMLSKITGTLNQVADFSKIADKLD